MPRATKPPEQFVVHDNCRFREPTRLIAPIRAQSIRILSQGVDCRGCLFCSLGHGVSVSNRCPLKTRSAFNPVGLAEQLANGDPRFAWIAFPLSDRVRNEIVEPE